MTSSIPTGHPYWHARSIVDEYHDEISYLHFSYYDYVPQSLIDRRTTFSISPHEFLDCDAVWAIMQGTPFGQELAFHSNVLSISGEQKHIPMVDMSTGSAAQLAKLKPFLGEELFQRFKWFRSGRSFHGYGKVLVTDREWVSLMGILLLANQKGLAPTVDPRWVGHRLIAGYSALRWTKNTSHYINLPNEID